MMMGKNRSKEEISRQMKEELCGRVGQVSRLHLRIYVKVSVERRCKEDF